MDSRLADIQRSVEVGFAKVDGQIGLLTERDRVAEALHSQQFKDVEALKTKVDGHSKLIAGAYGAAAALSSASGFIIWALNHH